MRSEPSRAPRGAFGGRRRVPGGILTGAGLLCAGLLYGYVLIPRGFCVPCPFRLVTGWKCPGCGITGICLDLLHGRFSPGYNWGLVLAAPWGAALVLAERRGWRPGLVRSLSWALLALLLAWGVLRNLWGL